MSLCIATFQPHEPASPTSGIEGSPRITSDDLADLDSLQKHDRPLNKFAILITVRAQNDVKCLVHQIRSLKRINEP